MPRSGTTWIGKVFDSHPRVSYRHEPDTQYVLNDLMTLYPDAGDAPRYREQVRDYCQKYLERCTVRTCGKAPFFPKASQSAFGLLGQKTRVLAAKLIERGLGRTIEWNYHLDDARIVWKSIESLGRLGVLLPAIPDSNGVIIQRDPCGYAASVLRGEKLGRFSAADSITEDWGMLDMLLATHYAREIGLDSAQLKALAPHQRLAWMWVLINQKACDDTRDMENVTIVRYEDLCRNPRDGFQRLFAFCGLEWEDQTDAFIGYTTATSHNNAYYSVVKDPLKAAYRWRDEFDSGQIDDIRSIVEQHPVGQAYYQTHETSSYAMLDVPQKTA